VTERIQGALHALDTRLGARCCVPSDERNATSEMGRHYEFTGGFSHLGWEAAGNSTW